MTIEVASDEIALTCDVRPRGSVQNWLEHPTPKVREASDQTTSAWQSLSTRPPSLHNESKRRRDSAIEMPR